MKKIHLPQNIDIETEKGIVVVGANGSGKTKLGSWIDIKSTQNKITHRISAQKSLNLPTSIRPMSLVKAKASLLCGHENATSENYADFKTGHKYSNEPDTFLMNDYEKLLVYLLSEHNEQSSKYLQDSIDSTKRVIPPTTKVNLVKKIWEEIMPHRELIIGGGDIQAHAINKDSPSYNASKMSDGERVVFYLIGQCLSAEKDSILVIDEPELHLHKSIQYSLWDSIENERDDCTFIYLTHDVDFAASRIGFKKIWLTDYDGSTWNLKELDDDVELPEELLYEVYGSRKKILLVEGNHNSHDVQFYKNIFSDFLIRPCGSCDNVITYTKTLRSNTEFHQLDVYGLIDKDRRSEVNIANLEEHGVFCLKVAEVENLFATPEVLKIIAEHLEFDFNEKMTAVKKYVLDELKNELELQIAERTAEELKEMLYMADVSSKTKEALNIKISNLVKGINLNTIYDSLKIKFDEIIEKNDYDELLNFYNRKTIAKRIGPIFGLKIDELPSLIIRLSKNKNRKGEFYTAIKKYLPEKLNSLASQKIKTEVGNK